MTVIFGAGIDGRTSRHWALGILCAGLGLLCSKASGSEEAKRLAEACVVVYNSLDSESESLAKFYAERRGIPEERLVGLICPTNEEISRAEFEYEIADPLRRVFLEKGWWGVERDAAGLLMITNTSIRFVALMRGIPLKIAQGTPGPHDNPSLVPEELRGSNAAAVDSELAAYVLAPSLISGAIRNPYYESRTAILDFRGPPLVLVTRLDGPSDLVVRQMIYDSLDAEQSGLTGWGVFDMRGILDPGYQLGNDWIEGARTAALRAGVPTIWDRREAVLVPEWPLPDTALYFGWYTGEPVGPMVMPQFRFRRGAVAGHIFSFSAASLRSPRAGWSAALLNAGAAATIGNTYEPYLALTTQPDILVERLLEGRTFAESAYAATQTLSWMNTFIGDPLYRPFAKVNGSLPSSKDGEAKAYALIREGARRWFMESPRSGRQFLEEQARTLQSPLIYEALGNLCLEENDVRQGEAAFDAARRLAGDRQTYVRTLARMVEFYRERGKRREALRLIDGYLSRDATSSEANVLQDLRREIDPPPLPQEATGGGG